MVARNNTKQVDVTVSRQEWLTVKDAAKAGHILEVTARYHIRQAELDNRFAVRKDGKRVLVEKAGFLAYIKELHRRKLRIALNREHRESGKDGMGKA